MTPGRLPSEVLASVLVWYEDADPALFVEDDPSWVPEVRAMLGSLLVPTRPDVEWEELARLRAVAVAEAIQRERERGEET